MTILIRYMWGALFGFVFTAAIVQILIGLSAGQSDFIHPHILESEYMKDYIIIDWQEKYERLLYLMGLLICPLFSYLLRSKVAKIPVVLLVASIVIGILCLNLVCEKMFAGDTTYISVWFVLLFTIIVSPLLTKNLDLKSKKTTSNISADSKNSPFDKQRKIRNYILSALLYFMILLFSLYPISIKYFSVSVASSSHVASFILSPSLYYLSPGATPTIDFESHYGVGHAWLFSNFLSNSLESSSYNLIIFFVACLFFFYATVLFILFDLLESPWYALISGLIILVFGFDNFSFGLPSNLPIRFPFIFIFIWLIVRATISRKKIVWGCSAGVATSISLIWQTDIGLYTLATGIIFLLLGTLKNRKLLKIFFVYLCSFITSFFFVIWIMLGKDAISILFLKRLAEPLLLYGNGFGGVLLNWQPGWWYLYNFIFPLIGFASIAWASTKGSKQNLHSIQVQNLKKTKMYLLALSLLGLFMLTKWVNRSIDVLWWLNGQALLIAILWWLREIFFDLSSRFYSLLRSYEVVLSLNWVRTICILVIAIPLVVIITYDPIKDFPGGSISPVIRAYKSFKVHPNLISYKDLPYNETQHRPVIASNTDFIKNNIQEGEQITLISTSDWVYLTDAKLPPKLHYMPLYLTHSKVLLERNLQSLQSSSQIFVELDTIDSLEFQKNPKLYASTKQLIDRCFEKEKSNQNWTIYRNICN
ncbi:hypothetical protein IQ249_13225 [Lusitaniella coriacea LEGE 07157]|uniref:Uncharacterized protein n=1 Tax=Lusitaniella coriacea LEGE 07157 TaxID=945747 RepID=A0A8J7DXA9_9CYAN|nr:hypothetical protein [Lusitaniella coriacea]MBE9116862.1 hypothetical protein [Lusitaniella coriacea LEGE 07157]